MSEQRYSIEITATELDLIRATLDRDIPAKPVRARKPKAAPAEPFAPNTGNPELDAFMRAQHRPDWEARLKRAKVRTRPGMISMPAPAPGLPKRSMSQAERAELIRVHVIRGTL